MKTFTTIIAASLAVAAALPALAIQPVGGNHLDTFYYLDGASSGYTGWIELDSNAGQFPLVAATLAGNYSGYGSPAIVNFDIVTPFHTFSSSDADVSVATGSTLIWNPHEITAMNLIVDDSDPWSMDVHFNIDGGMDLTVFPNLDLGGPPSGSDRTGSFDVPDASDTGFLLAGAGAALGGFRAILRRRKA